MQQNPYAFSGVAVADSPAAVRATFLKKVYGLVLAGVLTFAATLWAAGNVGPVRDLMTGLWSGVLGNRYGWLLYMAITMAGFVAVRAVARVSPLNLLAYFGWAFLLGLLTAPIVLWAASRDPGTLNTAAAVTAGMFTGLTAIVLVTGKDFSFLRGFLALLFWGLLIFALMGWWFGFGSPVLFSSLGALLFSGYILYDTSNVLHRYPEDMAVAAAVELFTDIVYLFKQVLVLLMSLRRD